MAAAATLPQAEPVRDETSQQPQPSSSSHPPSNTNDVSGSGDDIPEQEHEQEQEAQDEEQEQDNTLAITIKYHNQPITLTLPSTATISDLSDLVASDLQIPPSNQKFLVAPKPGLLRPPFKDPSLSLAALLATNKKETKITLLGSTAEEVADVAAHVEAIRAKQEARRKALRAGRKVQAYKHRDVKKVQEEATYTFAALRPLPHLRDPEKSLRFLERLRDDPGVKAAMRKHKFSVGLLTEMDPAEHTTHEGKTLGLNRNRGEVIELRLRTDAYDGYRDYKTIRRTLAHELAHNVVGPHNAEFHALWNQIEKEIERNDYSRGGHTLGAEEFYNPNDEGIDMDDLDADDGGWEGGAYVLGGAPGAGGDSAPLSRREAMAKAAEERVKQQQNFGKTARGDKSSGPSIG